MNPTTPARPSYRELDTVVLNRDLPEAGLRAGDLGAVVLAYGPAFDPGGVAVEFVTAAARPHGGAPVRNGDLLAVRRRTPRVAPCRLRRAAGRRGWLHGAPPPLQDRYASLRRRRAGAAGRPA